MSLAPVGARARGKEYVHADFTQAHAKFHVPSACEVDGWVYLTGVMVVPLTEEPTCEPAFERAFDHIGEVLALAHLSWGDVVKITSFHLDIPGQLVTMARVKDRYCGPPYPAWSVLGAGSLANPRGICEVEVIARRPSA